MSSALLLLHIALEELILLEVLYLMRDEVDCEGEERVLVQGSFSIVSRNSHVSVCVRRHSPLDRDVIEGGTKSGFQVAFD